jgi:hypothetical protein
MEKNELTTIPIYKETRDRLRVLGIKGESWDDLINRLITTYKKKR